MRKNILITSLGIKAVALSMGSVALSLGLNLVGLDSNQAQAALGLNALGSDTAGFNLSLQAAYTAASNAGNATTGLPTTTVIGWTGKSTVYASEIFGSGFASEKLPSVNTAAVYYAIDGSINVTKFDAKFTLDNGAVFGDTPTACLDYDTGTACTALSILGGDKSTSGGGSGKNYVVFQIDTAGNPITATTASHTTDAIVLMYNITSANALATSGSKIQMTATMRTPDPGYDVNPSSTITIAESKQGVKVELAPDTGTEADDDRITVASGGLEFAFTEATNEAKIGNLKVSNTCASDNCTAGATISQTFAHTTNGYTAWQVGTTGDAAVDSTKSTFTITGGQFAASVTAPGKVELTDGSTTISTQATDAETAVFKLTGANFVSLTGFSTGADINIIADNKNPVNLVENAPIGQLAIAYSNTKFQTITYPSVELKKIKQDGTRCTIYNVPAPGSADIVAIRITNDSGVDDIVNATLYSGDGTEIFPATPLNNGDAIEAGATLAVFGEDLAKLGTWTGRGVLVLTTELPSMEVLGLLREADNNAAPLTNLSTGATGSGCTN